MLIWKYWPRWRQGKDSKSSDHWTCEKMRIIKAWKWRKEDSVELAFYASGLVLIDLKSNGRKGKEHGSNRSRMEMVRNPLDRVSRGWLGQRWPWCRGREGRHGSGTFGNGGGFVSVGGSGPKRGRTAGSDGGGSRTGSQCVDNDRKIILDKCEAFIRRRIKTLEEIYSPERN